jgi:hypothetical protein
MTTPSSKGGAPFIVIEGIEEITKRDLAKHKELVERTKGEVLAYRTAVSHEVKKKRHYRKQIGGGKFNDDALRAAMKDININIRHLSDKAEAASEKLKHHELIVETLFKQLVEHDAKMDQLRKIRAANGP